MNRLQTELHRLYFPRPLATVGDDVPPSLLIDPRDGVRAMVMALARPPSWEVLSRVWHGVQTELELPAPAIAVSGIDSIQLWFSLAEPVTVPQAQAFLESLRVRFLPEVKPGRMNLWPALEATAQCQALHAPVVPARQETTGNWSAFVAPDLAPVFEDTPWLDIPPNEEGQAALLRGVVSMTSASFEAVLGRGEEAPVPERGAGDPPGGAPDVRSANNAQPRNRREPMARGSPGTLTATSRVADEPDATATGGREAMKFLLRIMNDDTVALALRIEAAKALLAHSGDRL